MTQPGSDAREVCGAGMRDARCRKLKYHDGAHDFDARDGSENCQGCAGMTLTHSRHCPRGEYGDWVSLPLSLAQRILAALEAEATGKRLQGLPVLYRELAALAAALRERLPQEPK